MWLYCPVQVLLALFHLSLFMKSTKAAPTDAPSAASFFVTKLPDLHQDDTHPLHIYSGHISADPNVQDANQTDVTPHLFFVMVKNRRTADKERIMFWFNGGPGCSSFDGLMMEVGPWRVDGKGGLKVVEGGWEEYTTMVYIDQPAGTGFSYTSTDKYVHTLTQASEEILEFLRNFYDVFPEYQNMETYLGGESYAGQFIPYFADAILNSNIGVNLKGAAIGNGWMDARRQYPAYLDYAVKHGILEENSKFWSAAKKATDGCVKQLDGITDREPLRTGECDDVLFEVAKIKQRTDSSGQKMCMNIYDVRYEDTYPACGMNWPPDLHNITTYLHRKDVVRALHATAKSESWTECRGRIHQEFHEAESNSSITLMPGILNKIPVLIFAGDQDFICNYMGLEAMIKSMTWNGATGLGTVKTESWTVDGAPAGTWVSSRNLTYVKIFNASHMVPFDVPHVAHDMILRFMGVNFSAILDGSAKIPSAVGTDAKPAFLEGAEPTATTSPVPGNTPEQNKAKWEAYYNAGSAGVVLVLILFVIGIFLWCRVRRRGVHLAVPQNEEESIPLNSTMNGGHDRGNDEEDCFRQRKGKERAHDLPEPPIFDVGDSDEEDDFKSGSRP